MRYLIDTHLISGDILRAASSRRDIFILDEVLEEYVFEEKDRNDVLRAGIGVLEIRKKHLETLKEVLGKHGDNLNLIRLFTNEGSADILMIAFICSEREKQDTLFPEEYSIVTNDKELSKVAAEYSIKCFKSLP